MSLLFMKKGLVGLLLVMVLCEFVVGGAYSEIETSFVIMSVDDGNSLNFLSAYGDYLISGILVLIVVMVYFNAIKGPGKKRRK